MRILFWTENYRPLIGGVETLARALATELARRGHVVELITNQLHPTHPAEESDGGVRVHRLPLRKAIESRNPRSLLEIRHAIARIRAELQPDIEHVHFSGADLALQQMPGPGRPPHVVVTIHVLAGQVIASDAVRTRLTAPGTAIVAVSKAQFLSLRMGAPELAPRLHCIRNALPQASAPRTPPPDGPPVVLAPGRLIHDKGFDLAIRAFQPLRDHPAHPHLRIVGDGPERSRLEELSRTLDLGGSVTFTGWAVPEEVQAALDAAHLVVVPSRWDEPFGLVALEAAQRGRPVVAAQAGGLPEIVIDGRTGRTFPIGDGAALTEILRELLDHPARWAIMGAEGARWAEDNFAFSRFTERHLGLYAAPDVSGTGLFHEDPC